MNYESEDCLDGERLVAYRTAGLKGWAAGASDLRLSRLSNQLGAPGFRLLWPSRSYHVYAANLIHGFGDGE